MSNKREAVLQAATELFSKHGYHAVGIDTIIAKSNVAKMTFYKYFPSKEFLIESVLIHRDQQLREGIMESVNRCRSPMNKLKAIFDWYENWFRDPSFHGCMFIKASEEFIDESSKVKKISQAHKSWLAEVMADILRDIGAPSPVPLAKHILIILDGLTVRSNMYGSEASTQTKTAWRYVSQIARAKAA